MGGIVQLLDIKRKYAWLASMGEAGGKTSPRGGETGKTTGMGDKAGRTQGSSLGRGRACGGEIAARDDDADGVLVQRRGVT